MNFGLNGFGSIGRELGTNKEGKEKLGFNRKFTDNPQDIVSFIKDCTEHKVPAWITAQPFRKYGIPFGIEKVFWDFDYEEKETDKKAVRDEVKKFVARLNPMTPLISETFKGYHIYLFLWNTIGGTSDVEWLKRLYTTLQKMLTPRDLELKYMDKSVIGDIMRMARIPLSIHEKSGKLCRILNPDMEYCKVRSPDYYRVHGVGERLVREAVKQATEEQEREKHRSHQIETIGNNIPKGKGGNIRPCFLVRLEAGEMKHILRLALLIEAYWCGKRTRRELIDLYRPLHDFDEQVTSTQVDWFLEKKVPYIEAGLKPYKCSSLMKHGFCLESEACPIWRKRMASDKS